MIAPSVTERLAAFVHECAWENIPKNIRHEAKRSLLNYFGCALGGAEDLAVRGGLRALDALSGPRSARVIGHAVRVDPLTASFINAIGGNALDFDDTHVPSVMHPTAPIAPPLFAFAEHEPGALSGPALLHAFVLGFEAACRIGNAVSRGDHYRRGWHITATCGVFGSAVGVATLMRFSPAQYAALFSAAGGQAAGLVENLATPAKSISVGNAARNGYLAALLVREGFTGPARPLEGRFGFAHVAATGADLDVITADLGSTWELARNTYKPYPTGVVLNPVIDACLDLRTRDGFSADAVDSIHVTAHPLLFERTDRPNVTSGRESIVSLQHTVAVTMLFGAAGLPQFTDALVRDPRVLALRANVGGTPDDCVGVGAAQVRVRLRDGRLLDATVTHARGSPERPLSDRELEDKLRALAPAWCDAGRLIDAIWGLDRASDAAAAMALASPPG